MIPKIKSIVVQDCYKLLVTFDDDVTVVYDVLEDINTIPAFKKLESETGLFDSFSLDQSRTVVSWTDEIDIPSDTIREYGTVV